MTSEGYLKHLIINSDYGLFCNLSGQNRYFDSISEEIALHREIQEKENILSLRLDFENKSQNPIKGFSLLIADFLIPKKIKVQKVLENGWLQCSSIKYKKPDSATTEKFIFLRRDQNHLSFKKEYGYLENSVISEWFTVIKMYGKDLLIGAVTTKNQFAQIFIREEEKGLRVRVTTQLDGISIQRNEKISSEKIVFIFGEEEKIKKEFAGIVKKEMGVGTLKGPVKAMCCSYYWNGNVVSEEIIDKELEAIKSLPEKIDFDYVQIDAGFTKNFGDWLDYKERFPNGLKASVAKIKEAGYKAGIWLSPFAVNPDTKLFCEHKSWFLKNDEKVRFEGRFTSPIDSLIPDLDLRVIDPTNPEFQKYLKGVLRHFKDCGFELYKLDFMYPVCLTTHYSKNVTRAQALRMGVELIREEIGDSAYLLSAITQMSPMVGIVDSARLGIDTLNPYICSIPGVDYVINNSMISANLRENRMRVFFNGIIWTSDPDQLVFRKGTGIDPKLIEKHKDFAIKNKTSYWVGDSLFKMNMEERKGVMDFINRN